MQAKIVLGYPKDGDSSKATFISGRGGKKDRNIVEIKNKKEREGLGKLVVSALSVTVCFSPL